MALNVTGAFSNINAVQKLNERELQLGTSEEASWHNHYKDSCYIFIGGLDPRLTEGDVAIVFSQWGEPIDVLLSRDSKTGVPRGFGFLGYEDQRSTVLAVDNANGMKLLNRVLRVDHCKNFRPPEAKEGEALEFVGCLCASFDFQPYQPTGAEGAGVDKFFVTEREKLLHKSREQQNKLREQRRQQRVKEGASGKDVDEMWAEEFEEMLKKVHEEADAEFEALEATSKKLKKKLKKEKKKIRKLTKEKSRESSQSRSPSPTRSRKRRGDEDYRIKVKEEKRNDQHKRHSSLERREEKTFEAKRGRSEEVDRHSEERYKKHFQKETSQHSSNETHERRH